jgi:hypothetical protein
LTWYDGDSWSNHRLNEIKCGECEQEFDQQEDEGNICPQCKEKEGEKMCGCTEYELCLIHSKGESK